MTNLPTIFQKSKPINLTGEEILDSLIMIAEKLEINFTDNLPKLKNMDGYFSSIIRSYVPWATYQHSFEYKHNPYYGRNSGKEILKKNLENISNSILFENKTKFDDLPDAEKLWIVPLYLCTTLHEFPRGYYERTRLKEIIRNYSFEQLPKKLENMLTNLFEIYLKNKGHLELREETNHIIEILSKNKIILPNGIKLERNISGREEDLFAYKERYFLSSVWEKDFKEDKEVIARFPLLNRNYFPGIDLFFGGVIYPYQDSEEDKKKGISTPYGYFISKQEKGNLLPNYFKPIALK